MTRYLNSFLITFVLYAGVIFTFLTIFTDDKILVKKEKPLQKTISLNHIELLPIPKIEKVVDKKLEKKEEIVKKEEPKKLEPKKVEKKKIEKKKVVKKVVKKKPKEKKPKKVVKKKKIIEKKIVTKEIPIEPISKDVVEKPIIEKPKTQQIVKEKIDVKQDYLAKHLRMIRNQIKKNVKYPKSAKRLNIQGIVRVKFTLHTNGKVDNIVILNGHSRLKKSTINAVKDAASSFPRVEKTITIELPIEYKLN